MNNDTEVKQSLRKMQDAAKVFYDFTYDPEYTLRTYDHVNYYRRNMMLKGYHSMNEKVMREAVDAALEVRAYYYDCDLPEVAIPADGHVVGLDDFLRIEQWFLAAAELTATRKALSAEGESRAVLSNGREKPWDNRLAGFILISKARIKYCDGLCVPTTPTLGRSHCRPDGEFDYMKNGHNRKVHETQFAAYAERQRWTKVPVQGIKAIIEAYENSSQELQEKLKKKWNMDWKKLSEDEIARSCLRKGRIVAEPLTRRNADEVLAFVPAYHLSPWNDGIVECWKNGLRRTPFTIPSFQSSSIPVLRPCGFRQVRKN